MLRKDIKFMLPIDLLNCSGRRSSCALLKGIWIILIDSMIQATNSLLMDLFETVICANKILIVYIFKSIFTPLQFSCIQNCLNSFLIFAHDSHIVTENQCFNLCVVNTVGLRSRSIIICNIFVSLRFNFVSMIIT